MWVPLARRQWVRSACQRSPALVGGKPDVGRLGPFVWCWFDEAGCAQVAADRGGGYLYSVVVLQVPGDGVGSGVESFAGQGMTHLDDRIDGGLR